MTADEQWITFPCLKVSQPIGDFFIGSVSAVDLVAVSYADVRRPEGREIERYVGTQRELSAGRVAELRKYVTTVDACFPTGVILAVSSENAIFDAAEKTLRLLKRSDVAKIIDGQHRIAGLEGYSGDRPFEINVTLFVDMDLEDQAMVFATINLKQTKVSKSLAYDLYEYTVARSPQKTSHNVAKLLTSRPDSALFKCIKILGKATGTPEETITQAAFVDRLLRLISRDPMADKDLIKRGKKPAPAKGEEVDKLVFRNRFLREADAQIAKILLNYFGAVAKRWPNAWKSRERGVILGRTTGFAALMRFLPFAMSATGKPIDDDALLPQQADFEGVFNKIDLEDEAFTSEKFKPGSSGEGALLDTFVGHLEKPVSAS